MIKLKDILLEVAEGGKGSGRKKKKGDKKWKGLGYDSFESVSEAVNVAKQSTKSLLRLYGQMKNERLSGQSALLFRLITKELVKRKVKLESVNEASSFDSVAKGWVKYFLRRHGKDIFKNVIAGREKERGKYSITDTDLWDQFGYYQHKDKKFGDWMGALAMIDFTLVSDMLGKEFSKKYPVEW